MSNTVVTAIVFNEVHNVFHPLLGIKVLEVKPAKLRASIYNCSWEVAIVSHDGEGVIDDGVLNAVEVFVTNVCCA